MDGSHNENDKLNPSNPYSATKSCSDQLILAWARTFNIPYVIIRPTNNYGKYQEADNKLIPRTCKYLSLNKKIELHNNGTPIRNWLHAYDTAQAILKIIEINNKNEIYNISGGYEQSNIITVSKIINCYLQRNINTPLTKEEIEEYMDLSFSRKGQDIRYSLDDSKLKALGWTPTKIFDKELPSIVEYYKSVFIW
jgi:dTDP-glucose 4,6-dehydratase